MHVRLSLSEPWLNRFVHLQKQKQGASLTAALQALEELQAAFSSPPKPAAKTVNATASVDDGPQAGAKLGREAEAELAEAQEALVAADEQARNSRSAYQTAARYASLKLCFASQEWVTPLSCQ